jgi:hypothetical protein
MIKVNAVVLFASLMLWEECILRVFESRELRSTFSPKRGKVTEGCRKLHNEQHDLFH